MAEELNILPSSIVAGESIVKTITGVTKSGTLIYSFQASTPFSVVCDDIGDSFVLSVSAAQTLTMPAGSVRFAAFQVIDGVSKCVDSGIIYVTASPLATSEYTAALAAVDAAILTYGSNPNRKIKVGQLDIEYKNLSDLLALRNHYRMLINRDLGKRGTGGLFFMNTRFQ